MADRGRGNALVRSTSLATFQVHLAVGLAASGVAATATLVAGLADPGETLLYLLLGTLGALLPDLDADSSAPTRAVLLMSALGIAFLVMFLLANRFDSVAELLLIWSASFLATRWLLYRLLTRVTAHRGMLHSLPAAILFGGVCVVIAHHAFALDAQRSWIAGSFVTFGYLIHLLLDELYSINLFGARSRRSLGSAVKLWSRNGILATILLYLAVTVSLQSAPDPRPLLSTLASPMLRDRLQGRFWPRDGWFRSPAITVASGVAGKLEARDSMK